MVAEVGSGRPSADVVMLAALAARARRGRWVAGAEGAPVWCVCRWCGFEGMYGVGARLRMSHPSDDAVSAHLESH